jgi:predicted TPR repeat methyltransferase
MSNPRLNPVLLLSPVDDGYVAYDPKRDWLHQLNPIAALLAELSDGSRGRDEIRALVAPLLSEDQRGTIDQWFENGKKVGLLLDENEADAAGAEAAREFTAGELLDVTKKLRQVGAVQAAYLCGKRTVELAPQNWDAWYDLGEIAQCVGRRDEARDAYGIYFTAHPEDGEIEHLLIALADGAPPPRASDQAILHIYKAFAASYDTRMRDDLKYVGPDKLMELTKPFLSGRDTPRVMDMGCGSGFAGLILRPLAADLTGVDLSPEMVELATGRNVYDRLEVAEITQWLDKGGENFDLIFSSDCLIYFGDLTVILAAAARRLKPHGVLGFSLERGEKPPFQLTDTGRYTHHPDHIRDAAAKSGLALLKQEESFLRMEWGEEVIGLYTVLGRKD